MKTSWLVVFMPNQKVNKCLREITSLLLDPLLRYREKKKVCFEMSVVFCSCTVSEEERYTVCPGAGFPPLKKKKLALLSTLFYLISL
jgi:hypothetical protein